METEILMTKLLNENWNDECELAGKESVHNIVHTVASGSKAEFRRAPGLANWDTESIKTIVEIATLLKTSIDIWLALTKLRGRKPTKQEFVASAAQQSSSGGETGATSPEQIFTLIENAM